MKKIFALIVISMSMIMGQSANAQGLGSLINKAVGAVSDATGNSAAGNAVSDLLAKFTGSVTTTKDNLVGTWNYSDPKVQFESDNLLADAGGSAMAQKVESKLALAYKAVGISAGKLKFTFTKDDKVTYVMGGKEFSGTYIFDEKNKTLTLNIPKLNKGITAYVTVSGNQMCLCFDSSKVMSLFTSVASRFSENIANIAGNYNGMKTGFLFTK